MRRLSLITGLFLSILGAQAQSDGKVVVGRYAQVRYTTGLHASPSASSRTYSHAQANQYLVVRPLNDKWYAVMMERGLWGYGLVDAIEMMPFELVQNQPAIAPQRGGTSRSRTAAAELSLHFIGTPYKYGGNDVNNGIDCSAFVKSMYGTFGLKLPRTAAEQALVGQPINRLEELLPGDRLYFWDKKKGKIGHTGMYIGGAQFVHASSTHHGVATDDLRQQKWRNMLVAARR